MTSKATDLNMHPTAPLPARQAPDVREMHGLISLFFPDFLRLAEPDSAARMDLRSCRILPATSEGDGCFIGAQIPTLRGEDVTMIVAVEPEALPTQHMAEKLARVVIHSELTHGLPVLLSVVYLAGGRPGLHLESAQIGAVGKIECVRIYFTAWGLAESRADHYLQRPEPLAWAMAPYMRSNAHTQQKLSEAAHARIGEAQLSDDLRAALLDFLPDFQDELNVEVA